MSAPQYRIVSFDAANGRIGVLFNDRVEISFDLPISPEGVYPLGRQLRAFIMARRPTPMIERVLRLEEGVANADGIAALVEARPETPLPYEPPAPGEVPVTTPNIAPPTGPTP